MSNISREEQILTCCINGHGLEHCEPPKSRIEALLQKLALTIAEGGGSFQAVVAWDGQDTPDVTKIPQGVTVTYNSQTYTGTLEAAGNLCGKLYFVYDTSGTTPNVYHEYLTIGTGSNSYAWELIGNTSIDLTNYVQRTDLATISQGGAVKAGTMTQAQYDALVTKDPDAYYMITE